MCLAASLLIPSSNSTSCFPIAGPLRRRKPTLSSSDCSGVQRCSCDAYAYSYDNAGNLLTRTDNRGIVTTNTYDALNRLKTTSYSDQITSTANFGYDGAGGNSFGQLTSFSNGNSTTNFTSFDVMGNVLASTQQIGGQTYGFSYAYNLANALTSETYPSGRVVQTNYDQANRPSLVTGIASGNSQSTNYAVAVHYAAHGALEGFARGNGVVSGYAYNNRLQLGNAWDTIEYSTSAYLYDETPNWGTAYNNGNLQAITVQAGGPAPLSSLPSLTTNYSYDAVNRLTGIWEPNYARGFSFDPAGNMWVTPNKYWGLTPTGPILNIFNGNNQASTLTYDKSGRVIASGLTSFAYDAENRQTQATDAPGIGGGTVTYAFDAIGERVQKQISGGAATAYVYDAFGKLAAEYSTGQNNSPCTTCYLTWDHLGTPRMVTDQNGNVVARHDYLPFGEEIQVGQAGRGSQYGPQADSVETKFTGQIRDAETGDDYFNARYYNGSYGRFMSPDPGNAGADITNPQSWNGYAYVGNNPLGFVDPSGMTSGSPCENNAACMGQIPGCTQNPQLCSQTYFAPDPVQVWDQFSLLDVAFKPTAALVVSAPFDYGDNPSFGNIFLVPIYGNIGAVNIVDALAEDGTDAIISPGRGSCPVEPPTGQYNSAPTSGGGYAVPLFMPPMANALGAALAKLNSQGIIPTITSGFRTAADQTRMINGGSGSNPAAKVSPHQVGMAVDIAGVNSAIIVAMTQQGLTWGGTFVSRKDPPHFQLLATPPAALVKACAGGNGTVPKG